MTTWPTGSQYEISHGPYTATITQVGATLRRLDWRGHELLDGFAAEEPSFGAQGQHLLPWPNRIADGCFDFGGRSYELPRNEPDRGNAIHGLTRDLEWKLEAHEDHLVRQSLRLEDSGWPGVLQLRIEHRLDAGGLAVVVSATNRADEVVPVGYGAHPYLRFDPSGGTTLTVPAQRYLVTDRRLLPVRVDDVAGSDVDLQSGRPLGRILLDTAFTGLRASEGRWCVILSGASRRVEVWGQASELPWVQVFTPVDGGRVALEPMSCAADAVRPGPTHSDLKLVAPGASASFHWGIRARSGGEASPEVVIKP